MKIDTYRIIEDADYCEEVFNYFLKIKKIKENKLKLFKKHIDKSLSNLEFANFILEEHDYSIKEKLPNKTFYDWCIVIYYYAIYHAASALVAKAGLETSSHLGTITAITLIFYHKSNILQRDEVEFLIDKIFLNKEDIDLVMNSKELRENASYHPDALFELRQATELKTQAVEFIGKVRGLIE